MIHLFRSAAAKIWAASILLLILLGIGIGIARLGLPWVAELRPDAEALATEFFGVPVEIGGLRARFRGLSPELELQQVRLLDPGTRRPQLGFRSLRVAVAPWRSLLSGEPQFGEIELAGARLALWHRPDGSWGVRGLAGGDTDPLTLLLPLLHDGRLLLRDSELVLEPGSAAALTLSGLELAIRNDGARHQLDGRARIAGSTNSWVQIAVDLQGTPDPTGSFDTDFYVKANRLSAPALAAFFPVEAYRAEAGLLDLELWGGVSGFRLQRLDGRVGVEGLALAVKAEPSRRWALDRLDSGLEWHRNPGGWRLDLPRLHLHREERRGPASWAALKYQERENGPLLRIGADRLPIDELAQLAALLPLPDLAREALATARPGGELAQLHLRLQPAEKPADWELRGRVDGLHSAPWRHVPGVEGVGFRFVAGPGGGRIQLDREQLVLAFPSLFRDPLELDRLEGNLDWWWEEAGLRLHAKRIAASNRHLTTWTRLDWRRPADGGAPVLDLQTDFRGGDGSAVSRYLPAGIMPPRAVAWLDRAIVSGRVPGGTALFRGPLTSFPFPDSEGRFEVWFRVEEGVLDYLDDWPRLEGVSANLRFLDNSLEIHADDGWVLGNRIERARVGLASLHPLAPLEVDGRLRGPLEDQLRVLRETPLKSRFGALAGVLQGRGESVLELDFAVPLENRAEPSRLTGGLQWNGAAGLNMPDAGISLDRLDGRLAFSLDGLDAEAVAGELFGRPVRIDVRRIRDGHLVTASGQLGAAELAARYPQLDNGLVAGSADWLLRMEVPDTDGGLPQPRLDLSSDLVGIALALPPPLGKAKEERKTFRLVSELAPDSTSRVDLYYADLLHAALGIEPVADGGTALRRAALGFGAAAVDLPAEPGVRIQGRIENVPLDPWSQWWERSPVLSEFSPADTTLPLLGVDLEVERLELRGYRFNQARLNLRPVEEGWRGRFGSASAEGEFLVPRRPSAGRLRVDLARLDLPLESLEPAAGSDSKSKPLDPRKLPELALNVERLSYEGQELGQLRLTSRKRPQGQEIQYLALRGPHLEVDANGRWESDAQGESQARLGLQAESPDAGELLQVLGLGKVIEKGAAELEADLEWSGGPIPAALEALRGRFEFHIGPGRFLEVDPGIGRVLGLFSLRALQRRLALDFSDTFREGLAFDNVQGAFLLDAGSAYTSNTYLEGPSARIDIMGRTDLLEQRYDQYVTVTPRVSTTIPVAAALAGGPAVGAAVLVAQQLMGKRLEQITSYEYEVKGPWDAPEFTRISTLEQPDEIPSADLLDQ